MDAIDFSGIPEHVLHTFSCNVAERALQKEKEAGLEPSEDNWKAIQIKRQWLKGEATDQDLKVAKEKAKRAPRHPVYCATVKSDTSPAWSSTINEARTAARLTAWAAANDSISHATLASPFFQARMEKLGEIWTQNHVIVREAALDAQDDISKDEVWEAEREWQRQHLASLVLDTFWKPFCEAIALVAQKQLETLPNSENFTSSQLESASF